MIRTRDLAKVVFWIGWLLTHASQAQTYTFQISESGIFKLTLGQAQKLGFADLSQVSFYGYPGMLPQKLDSAQLQLQEIPAYQEDGQLLVYLEGPHAIDFQENGQLTGVPNLFSDSISYRVGKNPLPKRIHKAAAITPPQKPSQLLYQSYFHREKETNLLESGREWYSQAIRSGQSLNINFGLESTSEAPWIISASVMGQSTSASIIRMLAGNDLIKEVEISAIPSSTYGIKGNAVRFQTDFIPAGKRLSLLRVTQQATASNSAGYLSWALVSVPRGENEWYQGVFRHFITQKIRKPTGKVAWEVSNFYAPKIYEGDFSEGKKWAIYEENQIPEIANLTQISLELSDSPKSAELLILYPKTLFSQAKRLQSHKESLGISTSVVAVQDIFDSFGYGNKDFSAIRNYLAWIYHQGQKLKNVLILGKGTFDYRGTLGGRPNLVPIYTSRSSLDPLTTYSSDDYYALLDWGQGEWKEEKSGDEILQIGIGRLPVINSLEAAWIIDKIISYESKPQKGSWKRKISLLADDGDSNIHLRDAESHAAFLKKNYPELLVQKIYLDRFEQEKSGTQQASPDAKSAFEKALEEGTSLVNFIGHGNETTLTAEEIFRVHELADWPEQDFLPIWMTATCEFGRHDSPFIRSAAEELLLAKNKGAIALLSTGRPVFSSVNFSLNQAFLEEAFKKQNGQRQDLGSIYRNTKNKIQNGPLNRNFSLIGDPSLRIPLPELEIKTHSIHLLGSESELDTLKAGQEVLLSAEIIDPVTQGRISGFEGTFELEIRDKARTSITLGNESNPVEFSEESNVIFRGRGLVQNGVFSSRFFVSQNIDPSVDLGKIRLWAESGENDWEAIGIHQILIGSQDSTITEDREGPRISVELNNQNTAPWIFPSTSLDLLLSLSDSSGVNTSSFNPTQLLTIQINGGEPIFLGNQFVATDGTYKSGSLTTKISGLVEGKNQLTIKAWDNVGNGRDLSLELEVRGSRQTKILTHKVFPNPASAFAKFELTHNRPDENLILIFEIYSTSAEILFSESIRLVKAEEKIGNLTWNFFQNQTKYPAKGTYIYKLTLQSEADFTFDIIGGKLVIE